MRVPRRGVAITCAALASALPPAGCNPAPPSDADSVRSGGGAPVVSDAAAAQPADSLQLRLELPSVVRPGAPVTMILHVRNPTTRPLDLYLRGRTTTVDVRVEDEAGSVIWQRLEGMVVPAIIQARTLDAGAAFAERVDWNGRASGGAAVAPGRYTVRAFLLTESEPLAAPAVTVRVE